MESAIRTEPEDLLDTVSPRTCDHGLCPRPLTFPIFFLDCLSTPHSGSAEPRLLSIHFGTRLTSTSHKSSDASRYHVPGE